MLAGWLAGLRLAIGYTYASLCVIEHANIIWNYYILRMNIYIYWKYADYVDINSLSRMAFDSSQIISRTLYVYVCPSLVRVPACAVPRWVPRSGCVVHVSPHGLSFREERTRIMIIIALWNYNMHWKSPIKIYIWIISHVFIIFILYLYIYGQMQAGHRLMGCDIYLMFSLLLLWHVTNAYALSPWIALCIAVLRGRIYRNLKA